MAGSKRWRNIAKYLINSGYRLHRVTTPQDFETHIVTGGGIELWLGYIPKHSLTKDQ
jgi:hypothetical protein